MSLIEQSALHKRMLADSKWDPFVVDLNQQQVGMFVFPELCGIAD